MKSLSSAIIAIAAAVATAIGALAWNAYLPPAPEVTFTTLSGERIPRASLEGKVVLVNFWATSCAVCIKEMPQLAAAHERHRARGFETIAVAMRYDPPNRVLAYVERTKPPFKVALDPMGELARAFGDVPGTPTTFLIDRRGRLVTRIVGEPDFAALDRLIERSLAEGPPAAPG